MYRRRYSSPNRRRRERDDSYTLPDTKGATTTAVVWMEAPAEGIVKLNRRSQWKSKKREQKLEIATVAKIYCPGADFLNWEKMRCPSACNSDNNAVVASFSLLRRGRRKSLSLRERAANVAPRVRQKLKRKYL